MLGLEEERVFRSGWQAVGRVDQVRSGGAFFTGQLLGTRFVVVRDQTEAGGTLRAFHNVCRHKAMAVASGSGTCTKFVCPYHGWEYNLQGRLTKALKLKGLEDFRARDHGLWEMRCEEWGRLVFVHFGSAAAAADAPTVREALGGAGEAMEAAGGCDPNLVFVHRREYPLQCNWKVFADNYLDGGYHVPVAHKDLAAGVDMASYTTRLYDGGHSVQSVAGGADADERLGSSAAYAFLFPNFMMNRYGRWLDTNWVVPDGNDRCRVVFDYYLMGAGEGEVEEEESSRFVRESLAASHQVQMEDQALCEGVQGGLESGAFPDGGRYAPMEAAMLHFHQTLHSRLTSHPSTNAPKD